MAITQEAVFVALKNAIKAILATLTPVPTYYDSYPKQNPSLPFVCASLVVDKPVYYFDGDDVKIDFQVSTYTKSESGPAGTRTINDAIVNGLNRSNIAITGLSGCSIEVLDKGGNIATEFIISGRSQQDRNHIISVFRIWGTGS